MNLSEMQLWPNNTTNLEDSFRTNAILMFEEIIQSGSYLIIKKLFNHQKVILISMNNLDYSYIQHVGLTLTAMSWFW